MIKEGRQVVLIVDDSVLICEQIKAAMKEENVFTCEAHNGQEALEMMEQYHPDVVLLDVVLPDTDGYELFDRLKEIDKNDASIIFLTSKANDEDVVRGFAMGAYDYIKKPFVKGEFLSRVRAHLQIKKKKDELNRQNKELRSNMAKLNYMAFRDGLTGLYNRRYVVDDLVEDIQHHDREDTKNVIILADIDDFKKINDTYGHDAGDRTLVCIANLLEVICRRHRVVRWGGEEFLVVLFAVTKEEAEKISEQIRREIEEFTVYNNNSEFSCTVTLGLHVYQADRGVEENIKCADEALYQGKRDGKNRYVWYREKE